jgi:hypothetical protein
LARWWPSVYLEVKILNPGDKNGVIAKIFPKVRVDKHYEEVLAALENVTS